MKERIKYNISENDISILYSIYIHIISFKMINLNYQNILYNSYTSKSLMNYISNLENILYYYFDVLSCY